MSKTCAVCRSRKVRCDGVHPVCGPCSRARRQLDCIYTTETSQGPKGPLLQKGSACYSCRRKKKKCDARRPYCTTCEIAGKGEECLYEENAQRNLTVALVARTHELEQRLAMYEIQGQSTSSSPQIDGIVPLVTAGLNDFLSAAGSLRSQSLIPFVVDNANVLDTALPPPGPSSLVDGSGQHSYSAEVSASSARVQYTAGTPTSQDMSEFRSIFLSHHGQLGISLPEAKLHAILTGDISGTHAHPVLIYVAQLMGCRLWQEQNRRALNIAVEQIQLQAIHQALLDTPDPVTRLQVHSTLAIYFLLKRHMREGRDQLLQGARVAVQYNIRFDDHSTEAFQPFQDSSSEVQEHICALSQLLYLDKAASIVLSDPSLLSADYDEQFRALPYAFPIISRSNLVILRTRSVALLQQSRKLASQWIELILSIGAAHGPSASDLHSRWYDEYWELLEDIIEHIATLNPPMLKSSFFHQRETTLALKMCLIISLTASAELHHLLARHHVESRMRCIDVVFEIVGITRTLKDDDYIFLDPILGTCWSMVATILNQERISPLDETCGVQWKSSFSVILDSASRLGRTLPFMEDSVETINTVASIVEAPDGAAS